MQTPVDRGALSYHSKLGAPLHAVRLGGYFESPDLGLHSYRRRVLSLMQSELYATNPTAFQIKWHSGANALVTCRPFHQHQEAI